MSRCRISQPSSPLIWRRRDGKIKPNRKECDSPASASNGIIERADFKMGHFLGVISSPLFFLVLFRRRRCLPGPSFRPLYT